MKHTVAIVLLCCICSAGFCQHLSLKEFGTSFHRANLDVRWEAPKDALPTNVWVYRLSGRKFSDEAVSNLMAIGSFTQSEKQSIGPHQILFKTADNKRMLAINDTLGGIYYESRQQFSPEHLAKDVPTTNQIPGLTSKYLAQFGINESEIVRNQNKSGPWLNIFDSTTVYYKGHTSITNTEWRGVRFRRAVDTGEFVGGGTGGNGEIHFGEHGQITRIEISWRNLERYKSYRAATPATIGDWIREGKAVETGIPMNELPIDWATVKALTVKQANVSYYAGSQFAPSDWLIPLASLWTTVERDNGQTVDLEIDCPIYEDVD